MKHGNLNLKANCRTTAMGIMPHTDVERALDLALSLDIPFWPQLPNISFYEDMYAQTSENFPGIITNPADKRISFDTTRFEKELIDYSQKMAAPETVARSHSYAAV